MYASWMQVLDWFIKCEHKKTIDHLSTRMKWNEPKTKCYINIKKSKPKIKFLYISESLNPKPNVILAKKPNPKLDVMLTNNPNQEPDVNMLAKEFKPKTRC